MNLCRIWWISVVVVLLGVVCVRSASLSLPKDPFLGIAPEDESYYKTSSDTIKCKDGSNKFTKSQLNDDFCDCPDGTDEPGTSACPGGKFFCRNAGHVPLFLYSSRVNDGICDCCDGSDEYYGKVNCPNICWETGKVARDKLKTKIATYQEGVSLRKQEVEQAKIALAKDEAELSKLISDEKILKGLVQQLKERKEQIERAEEKERLQKEEIEKKKKEAEEAAQKKMEPEDEVKLEESKDKEIVDSEGQATGSVHDDRGLLEDSPSDKQRMDVTEDNDDDSAAQTEHSDISGNEGSLINRVEQHTVEDKEEIILPESKEESAVVPETGLGGGSEVSPDELLESGNDVSENDEELSREELGRLVASRWTGEKAEKQTEEVDSVKDNDEGHEEMSKYASDEEYDGYASETDDDSHKYDDDIEDEIEEDIGVEDDDSSSSYKVDSDEDESDLSDITTPSHPSWLEKIQQTVRNILQAVNLFQTPVDTSEAAHVRKEYEESSTKLSKIQSRISSLTRKLKHDLGPEKEFYSFYGRCFESKQNKYVYKVCPFKQASQIEGHSTTRLGNWDKFDDSYQVMLFSSGDKCWNGPDRSIKIKLRCGLKNEVTDVDEPSRCEYVALLSTPTLCLEEKLKELQNKLELMNKEQPQSHDEL